MSLDVLTLAEAKAAVQIATTDTSQDTALAGYVAAVSQRLDRLVGPVVQRNVTDERLDGGHPTVWVRYWPVSSFTTVTEHRSGVATVLTVETATVLPDAAYLAPASAQQPGLRSGQLIRRAGGRTRQFAPGAENIVVSYLAGRFANTSTVDELFKAAARIMLQNLWRAEQQSVSRDGDYDVPAQSFPAFAVPKAALEVLSDHLQTTPGFR